MRKGAPFTTEGIDVGRWRVDVTGRERVFGSESRNERVIESTAERERADKRRRRRRRKRRRRRRRRAFGFELMGPRR